MIELVVRNGRRYAQFSRLRQCAGLVHAFSTRPDDVSPRTTEGAALRAERRAASVGDWRLDPALLMVCQQVHGPEIAVVKGARRIAGERGIASAGGIAGEDHAAASFGILTNTDAAITANPGRPLMSFSADCPLILLFDPVKRAVGVVHASWRCTVSRNTARTVERMVAEFGSRPADLLAGIGPGAGPCCYEVKEDVREAARSLVRGTHPPNALDRFFPRRDGRMHFDLWSANRAQLIESGLPEGNIEQADVCTMCRTDLFFSFRREGPGCGHFGLLAAVPDSRATAG